MTGLDPFNDWFGERKPVEPAARASETAEPISHAAVEPEPMTADTWDDEPAGLASALEHALALIGRGCKLVPVHASSKRPVGDGWQNNATGDAARVRSWLDAGHLYGVAGGHELSPGRHLVIVDLDVKHGLNGPGELGKLEAAYEPLPDTFTVATPSKGRHLYFATDFPATNSHGGLPAGIDIRGRGGQCVGPGCAGSNGEHYEVMSAAPIADAPNWLAGMLRTVGGRDGGKTIIGDLDTPERIEAAKRFLRQDAPLAVLGQHGDDTTVKRVAMPLYDIGVSVEAAHEFLLEYQIERDGRRGSWNDLCLPPWDRDELLRKCQSAWNSKEAPVGCSSPEAFGEVVTIPRNGDVSDSARAAAEAVRDEDTLAALLAMAPLLGPPILAGQARPSVPWLVKRVIPRTGVGVIYGPSTGGKSYLVMDLAAKLWQGLPWFGAKVPERRATVIFAFEGADFAGYRLDALRHAAAGDQPAVMVIPAGRMTPAGLKSLGPQLRGIDQFFRKKFGLGVGLVAIDTVSAAGLAEKEDKADDVAPAIKAVQEFAGTVGAFGLLVHHPNKGGGDMRGSGAWFNNTDTVLRLEMTEGHPVRTLVVEKVKDGPTRELGSFVLEGITLGSDEDNEPITACVVATADKPNRQAIGGTAHFEKFVQAFEEAAEKRGASLQGEPIAPLSEVEERFKEAVAPHYKANSGVRTAWMRCRRHAEETGIIRPVRGERNTFSLTNAAYEIEDPNAN